jgi:type IV pilus assembly protein PilN
MIRINLLPVREAKKRESGKQMLLLFVALVIVEVGVFFYWSSSKDDELASLATKNAALAADVKKLEDLAAKGKQIESEKAELERQKQVLDSIVEGQTGPVNMLGELSLMLTSVDDPALKLAQKKRGWNADWDPKRLWIKTFVENNRVVKVTGFARSNDDLAEFLHRLSSARHFTEVKLNYSAAAQERGMKTVQFDIDMLALYGQTDLKKLAAGELGVTKKTE